MTYKPVLLKLENKEHCIFKQWAWSQAAGSQSFTYEFYNWLSYLLLYSTFSSAVNDP